MDVYGLYFTHLYHFLGLTTNRRPSPYCVFLPIQYFKEKEYQTESKWNETFGNVIFSLDKIQETWTLRQESHEAVTRVGGTPPASWTPRSFLDVHSMSSGSRLFQKSRSRRFHSIWTPFDIRFLRNSEIGKKQQYWVGPPVNSLVPKII